MHKVRSFTCYIIEKNRLKKKDIQIFKDSPYVDYRSKMLQLALYYKEEESLFKNLKKYYVVDAIFDVDFFTVGFYID